MIFCKQVFDELRVNPEVRGREACERRREIDPSQPCGPAKNAKRPRDDEAVRARCLDGRAIVGEQQPRLQLDRKRDSCVLAGAEFTQSQGDGGVRLDQKPGGRLTYPFADDFRRRAMRQFHVHRDGYVHRHEKLGQQFDLIYEPEIVQRPGIGDDKLRHALETEALQRGDLSLNVVHRIGVIHLVGLQKAIDFIERLKSEQEAELGLRQSTQTVRLHSHGLKRLAFNIAAAAGKLIDEIVRYVENNVHALSLSHKRQGVIVSY